jgi:transposase
MSTVTTIGLDIAKSVFQVHGISATGEVLIRRQVRRGQMLKFFASLPPCLIGIEACASAHHWSRELQRPVRYLASRKGPPNSGHVQRCARRRFGAISGTPAKAFSRIISGARANRPER